MSLSSRIAGAERAMSVIRPGLRTVIIRGGVAPGVADIATIDGEPLARAEGETPEAFRARAREAAISSNAKCLVFGGLPPMDRDDEGAA
jgi:hypothetical protein